MRLSPPRRKTRRCNGGSSRPTGNLSKSGAANHGRSATVTTVLSHFRLSVDNAKSAQLPQADIAHDTRPRLWAGIPETKLSIAQRQLDHAPPGDRMLVALNLPVTRTAQRVAAALAYYGWGFLAKPGNSCGAYWAGPRQYHPRATRTSQSRARSLDKEKAPYRQRRMATLFPGRWYR